jgi:hypothetical protein
LLVHAGQVSTPWPCWQQSPRDAIPPQLKGCASHRKASGWAGGGRRRGRASSFRAAFRIPAPMTICPEGDFSTSSAWSSAMPACRSRDSSAFGSRQASALLAERGAALAAHVHGGTGAAWIRASLGFLRVRKVQTCGREVKVPDIQVQRVDAALQGTDGQLHSACFWFLASLISDCHLSAPLLGYLKSPLLSAATTAASSAAEGAAGVSAAGSFVLAPASAGISASGLAPDDEAESCFSLFTRSFAIAASPTGRCAPYDSSVRGVMTERCLGGWTPCNHLGGGCSGTAQIRSWSVMPSGPGALLGNVSFCANNSSVRFLLTML